MYGRDNSYPQLSKKCDWFTVIVTRSVIPNPDKPLPKRNHHEEHEDIKCDCRVGKAKRAHPESWACPCIKPAWATSCPSYTIHLRVGSKITWYSVGKMSSLYGTFADSLCQVVFVRSLNLLMEDLLYERENMGLLNYFVLFVVKFLTTFDQIGCGESILLELTKKQLLFIHELFKFL